jgi:hypothetical protein
MNANPKLSATERMVLLALVILPNATIKNIIDMSRSRSERQIITSLRTLVMAGLVEVSTLGAVLADNRYRTTQLYHR